MTVKCIKYFVMFIVSFTGELQEHLQRMVTLLREEDSLKMVGLLSNSFQSMLC